MSANDERWIDEDFLREGEIKNLEKLVVFSRDWTVETMLSQIDRGNIDLNPKFQRRNAWSDEKRCRLIESLIAGIPVPEIVLAEDPSRPKSYIVIDGKQRLMTIAGFMNPAKYHVWERPRLANMVYRPELNGQVWSEISTCVVFEESHRSLINADIRCTVLSNISSSDMLFDIFYRLNTGSVPLSAQELRQVLCPGDFADYLLECTDEKNPIQNVLEIEGPDDRLLDAELLLRIMSFSLYGSEYSGNLNAFLEGAMRNISGSWSTMEKRVREKVKEIFEYIEHLHDTIPGKVGRKYIDGKWQRRFNKSIFEVEILSLMALGRKLLPEEAREFESKAQSLFSNDPYFLRSVEATTKSLENYKIRFSAFQKFLSELTGEHVNSIPGR